MIFTGKDLKKLILPLIVEQILNVTIGMADTIMVANCGEAAVSSVSLVDSINLLLIFIFTALANGGAIIASQYIGKGDKLEAGNAAKQLLYVVSGLSVLISAACLVGRIGILQLVYGGIEADVMHNAQIYFFYTAFSYLFVGLYNAGAALFRAIGNSKTSMLVSIGMNLINVVGNAILIFGFGMGVAGAAIATLFSRIVGSAVILYLLRYKEHRIEIVNLRKVHFNLAMIKKILYIGIPNGLENGMFQLGKILTQSIISGLGTMAIAANAVANMVGVFSQIPGMAMGMAMTTVVGQCVGARDYTQARHYMKKLLLYAYMLMGGLNIVLFAVCPLMVMPFALSSGASEIAVSLLRWHCVACVLIWPGAFVLPNGLRASNDVKFVMGIAIFSMWAFRVGLSYVFVNYVGMGALGVWMAMFCDWIFRIVVFAFRFRGTKWQTRQLV